jgi:hypothetical protein
MTTSPDALAWVGSSGGPLLLLPIRELREWGGTNPPPPDRPVLAASRWDPAAPACDYDRACDLGDPLAVMAVGAAQALVLGDQPRPTTWIPHAGTAGILVRWCYGPSDEVVAAFLCALPELAWGGSITFDVAASPLLLFDSAESGVEIAGHHRIVEIAPGLHRIDTAVRQDSEIGLILHRFVSTTT